MKHRKIDVSGAEDHQSVDLCNATLTPLMVWLEPWALEFPLPARGTLSLVCSSDKANDVLPEIEFADDQIIVWGTGESRIAVFINGVDQDSFSARYTAPDLGALSSKAFVNLVFGDHPNARPGGAPLSGSMDANVFRRWHSKIASSLQRVIGNFGKQ